MQRVVKKKPCDFDGCERIISYAKYCKAHSDQLLYNGKLKPLRKVGVYDVCTFQDCGKPHYAKGLCRSHAAQLRRGSILKPIGRGRTARWVNDQGYVICAAPSNHPNAYSSGVILEHTLVMSQVMGRPIRTEEGENVHHKNGIRHDNRPENLELWVRRAPPGQRVSDRVHDALETLVIFRDELLFHARTETLSGAAQEILAVLLRFES